MTRISLLIAAAAIVGFAGTASADQPDGTLVFKDGPGQGTPQGCGQGASQIIQNGQFVSGNAPEGGDTALTDQTTGPHTRADLVVGDCNSGQGTPGEPN